MAFLWNIFCFFPFNPKSNQQLLPIHRSLPVQCWVAGRAREGRKTGNTCDVRVSSAGVIGGDGENGSIPGAPLSDSGPCMFFLLSRFWPLYPAASPSFRKTSAPPFVYVVLYLYFGGGVCCRDCPCRLYQLIRSSRQGRRRARNERKMRGGEAKWSVQCRGRLLGKGAWLWYVYVEDQAVGTALVDPAHPRPRLEACLFRSW